MKWHPIETHPKDGEFLVYGGEWRNEQSCPFKQNKIAHVRYCTVLNEFEVLGTARDACWIYGPTHWAELIEPTIK